MAAIDHLERPAVTVLLSLGSCGVAFQVLIWSVGYMNNESLKGGGDKEG